MRQHDWLRPAYERANASLATAAGNDEAGSTVGFTNSLLTHTDLLNRQLAQSLQEKDSDEAGAHTATNALKLAQASTVAQRTDSKQSTSQ